MNILFGNKLFDESQVKQKPVTVVKNRNEDIKRGDLTTVSELIEDDRFYKASDKKKDIWTVVKVDKIKVTKYRTYIHAAIKDNTMHPEYLNADTKVVFLRNKND